MGLALVLALLYIYFVSGKLLERRFNKLGQAVGMTPHEIVAVVGEPDQTNRQDGEMVELLWTSTTFWMCLMFSDGLCIGQRAQHDAG